MNEWLQKLSVGDKVIVRGPGAQSARIEKINRLTATQLVVGNQRFRRDSGIVVGEHGYWFDRLHEATAEAVAEIQRRKYAAAIKSMNHLEELPLEVLKHAYEILRK